MRKRTASLFALVAVLMAACRDQKAAVAPAGPETGEAAEFAEFMGTRAEREARAPYSPPGWPLQPGDLVTRDEKFALADQFPSFEGVQAHFWIGDKVFGAAFKGAAPAIGERYARNTTVSHYLGHFPDAPRRRFGRRDLPPHLRDLRDQDFEKLRAALLAGTSVRFNREYVEKMKTEWTRERWIAGYTGDAGDGR